MDKLPLVGPGDRRALSAEFWNEIVDRVNHLWSIQEGPGFRVHKSDGNVTLSGTATRGGLFGLDPEIKGFIHVGTDSGLSEYNPQQIRNWAAGGYEFLDRVGQWNVWEPDGTNDFVWRLQLELPFHWKWTRAELYQVTRQNNSNVPYWDSGQAWATQFLVKPFEHQPGRNEFVDVNGEFEVFPLKIWHGGSPLGSGTEVNTDYGSPITSTTYTGGIKHTFYLAGNRAAPAPASQYFRILLFLESAATGNPYTIVRGTISTAPTNPPTEV